MWERHLHHMYQQWLQGNEDYVLRYMDFANLVARHNNMDVDNVILELKNYQWFKQPY